MNDQPVGTSVATLPDTGALPAMPLSHPSTNTVLLLAIVLLVSAWPFIGALDWLWSWWTSSPEYSHGILIPALTAFLIWSRRDQLAEIPFQGSWVGVTVVFCAAVLYWMGKLATLHVVDNVAYWLLLCGITLSLMGWKAFRIIAAPMALLLLSIPLPEFLLANLSAQLQLWSSNLGVMVIRAFGISVLLQGNVIDLGPYKLEVAEACSGLRYLFPLLTLGFLMAYLYQGALWKRVLIALSSLPLTVLMNSLRVGSIGIMVDNWGPSLAEGFVHDFQGWAMFMCTGAIMFGLLVLLHRSGGSRESWREAFGIPAPVVRPPGTTVNIAPVPRAFIATSVIVAGVAVVGQFAPAAVETAPDRSAFVVFPTDIDGWVGRRQGLDSEAMGVLQLDDYLLADYARKGADPVNLYIAYYKAQHTGQSVHSPKSCLPGGGWVMTEFGQRDVAGILASGQTLRVNRAIVELGRDRQLVYYWFRQRGRQLTSEYAVKWYLLVDGITKHRSDGALVRLVTPLAPGEDVAAADRRLQAFAAPVVRLLPAYVPD